MREQSAAAASSDNQPETRRRMQRDADSSHVDAFVVGLMSGTSLDGISAAVVHFTGNIDTASLNATLLAFIQRQYAPDQRARIESAMHGASARDYCRLHVDLGRWLADAALEAIGTAGLDRSRITCIASHGQTLWHEPGHSTWQVGDPSTIAERTGCAVIADFRARDVAAGGQGAPLVPMADAMLFAHPTEWRALQNIGGIANVTVVPPSSLGAAQLASLRAFDTGPGVVLVDAVTRRLWPDLPYDVDGRLANQGHPIAQVVDEALSHAYFREMPPKSTGRELFSATYVDEFIGSCRKHGASDVDIVASAVELTGRSIADQYERFISEPLSECVISGGGASNPAVVRAITRAFESVRSRPLVKRFSELFFDGDAKEAVAFALLGLLTMHGRPGNVPTATGAGAPRQLGVMVPA